MSRHAGAPLQAYARGSTSGVVSMACRCMVSMLADLPHWLHGHAARAAHPDGHIHQDAALWRAVHEGDVLHHIRDRVAVDLPRLRAEQRQPQ